MKSACRIGLALFVVAVLLMCASGAYADSFKFSITGADNASGILTTGPLSGGTYLIRGISGSQNGHVITSLIAPNGFAANDNILYVGSPSLDTPGFSFVANGIDYNVYYDGAFFGGSATRYYETTVAGQLGGLINFSVTPVQEPSTLLLLCSGLFGLVIVARRKLSYIRTPAL
jgi:hypothetical protein